MKTDAKLLEALSLLDRGDWQKAHGIVQEDDTQDGAWLHGIVHVLEGDMDNARYWYRRANRTFSADAPAELDAARNHFFATKPPG
jgi:hypothetical protein